jgi:putative endonuclease
MFFYTYVLNCENQDKKSEFYIGSCKDLINRVSEHQNKEVTTTKKFDKITLVYYEACLNKTDARKRELQLKTGFGRGYLKRRIESYTAGIVQR